MNEQQFEQLEPMPLYDVAALDKVRVWAAYPMPNGLWIEVVEEGISGGEAASIIDELQEIGGDAEYRVEVMN